MLCEDDGWLQGLKTLRRGWGEGGAAADSCLTADMAER